MNETKGGSTAAISKLNAASQRRLPLATKYKKLNFPSSKHTHTHRPVQTYLLHCERTNVMYGQALKLQSLQRTSVQISQQDFGQTSQRV